VDLSSLRDEDLDAISKGDMTKVSDAVLEHLASGGFTNYGPNELQGPNVKDDRPPSGWTGGKASNSNINVAFNPKVAEAQLGWKDGVPPMVSLPMGTGANLLKAAAGSLMNQGAIRGLGAGPGAPILASTAAEASAEPGVTEALKVIKDSAPKTDWSGLGKTVMDTIKTGGIGAVGGHYLGIDPNLGGPNGTGAALAVGAPLAAGAALSPLGGMALDQLALKAIARRRGGGK
jgi:hypothetical protein